MYGDESAEQERDQRQRDEAREKADDQGDAAEHLRSDGHMSEEAGKTKRPEEFSCDGGGQHEELHAAMGKEQNAQSDV